VKEALPYLQGASATAFLLLGAAITVAWLRQRNGSLGYVALAIVLLCAAVLLAGIPALSLVAFMGCSYALLRYRAALIPISARWHMAAVLAMAASVSAFVVSQTLVPVGPARTNSELVTALVFVLVWATSIVEPIIRFWLVARRLPEVQAWRLRYLSFGFGGLVAIVLLGIGAGAFTANPGFQVVFQLLIIGVVPVLYVSFSPPPWLRRQWRASEEEGLRYVMQDLLVLEADRARLVDKVLLSATRLVGAGAAVMIDHRGQPLVSHGLEPAALADLGDYLANVGPGRGSVEIRGSKRATLAFPLTKAGGEAKSFVLIASPFTPAFGADEENRAYQFVTATTAALDRLNLIDRLEATNTHLLEANKHKSVFLANMSHELRTPLTAIIGFSELLRDDTTSRYDAPTRFRFLDQVLSGGKHLLGLINDILDLSKVEAGQMDLHLQEVAVDESIQIALATVEPLAGTKEIVLDSEPAQGLHLVADPAKLKQMLLNLLSNAIKFTPRGGRVTIRTRQVDSWIDIAVSDTGIGIAKSDLGRLFTEFQQLDAGPGREQEGTGLGLALTKRFAELHGGHVSVESVPGEGSTFIIKLPAVAKKALEVPAAVAPRAGTNDLTRPLVLLVEDSPEAAEILVRHLEAGGFRQSIARSGSEALSMARELQPVAITLDILLPGIDGWEVLTRLKADRATRDIPVLIVSVVDNPALGRALGALDYFVKPVDSGALLSRLKQYAFLPKAGRDEVRVLVVDDEPANLDALQLLLEKAGFIVLKAPGGKQGIAAARSKRPDLILLDLLMPDVTGFDVVEALRAEEATRSIPIMVLTAKELTEDDKRALNGHVAAAFQRDSVGGAELVAWLRALVEKRVPV